MRKGKRFFLVAITILSLSSVTQSQTVRWCIPPKFDNIEAFGEDLFKCVGQKGRIQLFDQEGKTKLNTTEADAITDFVDGYAIVLNGNKILGFVSDSQGHVFTPLSGEYLITQYPFFSEGLLVVDDGKGKMGYINANGQVVIPCKYNSARPFKQGFASVEVDKKKFCYINLQGKTCNPDRFHGGKLTKCSNFNENGEAVVANYQDYAVIGTNMQVKRKIDYTPNLPVRDCDYAYSTNAEPCPEKNTYTNKGKGNLVEVFSKDGLYGYRWNDGSETELPAQFGEAQPFFDERAIVEKDGKFGVIELVAGKIVANWPADLRVYPDGKSNRLNFSLEVPTQLDSDKIDMEFDAGDGNYKKDIPLDYTFQPSFPKSANRCSLRGRVSYDGLLLCEFSKELKVNHIAVDIKAPVVTSTYADENDTQTVKTVITNTSNVTVMISASLNVAGQTAPFKGKLAPKQSKVLTVAIKVAEDKTVHATVSVQADGHDCGTETSQVALKRI